MKRHFTRSLAVLCIALFSISSVHAAEVQKLTAENWDRLAPAGKEVDAIYGDYVLRNDRIVAVIADATPDRYCNVKVHAVGGCIIDLTTREQPNDQLTAYLPGGFGNEGSWGMARAFPFSNLTVTQRGTQSIIRVTAPATDARPEVQTEYVLDDGLDFILVRTQVTNSLPNPVTLPNLDAFIADRTFEGDGDGANELWWVYDPWFEQAYGLQPLERVLVRKEIRGQPWRYAFGGQETVTLQPRQEYTLTRRLHVGRDPLSVRGAAMAAAGKAGTPTTVEVSDSRGPVEFAMVEVSMDDKPYAKGRTNAKGVLSFARPAGKVQAKITALGDRTATIELTQATTDPATLRAKLGNSLGTVTAWINDENGGPIPCKVQFYGRNGTKDPFFFPDSGEHFVHNCYYSHNGRFQRTLPAGSYDVVISRGPEYDAIFTTLEVGENSETVLRGTLKRTVDTSGWISADFHSHASPSGDNTASQYGRVLNLLAEHIEYAPCTEHNRVDSYEQHLRAMKAEYLMGTSTGIELTGSPGDFNHQNAFPLKWSPRTQDGGGPRVDADSIKQIERLARWDDGSDKLVQQNHPNIARIAWDLDLDGKADGGVARQLGFMDVIEVHPPDAILRDAVVKNGINTGENRMHTWLQLINQGTYVPGVVNTDAHYNFHGSGWLRNYIKSSTDDPAKIDTMDIVHESQKGHVILSTGPFMEATVSGNDMKVAIGYPGDTITASDGKPRVRVRVQCPNWLNIDRVQILVNGRRVPELNFTREANSEMFGDGVVKFDQEIEVPLEGDAHLIVVAIGEGSTLGRVFGPDAGKMRPVAVTNPFFIDVDGNGFKANGDPLDAPLAK